MLFRSPSSAALTLQASLTVGTGPSFLAFAPDFSRLYANDETGSTGRVIAFALERSDGGLRRLNEATSGGKTVAHVAVDHTGNFVMTANYGDGFVAVLPVTDAGIGAPLSTYQPGVRAHQIVVSLDNRFVYVPCLGSDLVAQYALDGGALTPLSPSSLSTAAKAGPRHLALHPNGRFAYLINELDSTLQALELDASGRFSSTQTVSSLPPDAGANTGAEVLVHPNGQFVYASNRGHDSIATFRVEPATGHLTLSAHTPTGGRTPRHFAIDASGTLMLVANQDTNDLHAFRIEPTTGQLTALGRVATPQQPKFVAIVPTR